MSRTHLLISALTLISIFPSCESNEIGNSKDVNPDAVFFDYLIWAEEGREDVTVNIQYRMGGRNGTTLILDEPSKVLLDGEQMKLDSAKVTGAFYEVQKPLASFPGKHVITFNGLDNKQYKEEFEFVPFTLDPEVPAVMHRGDLVLTNGPINLQFYKEIERPLKSTTKEGGRLYISYGLKREFELKDAADE
jgi:hypothetical protein